MFADSSSTCSFARKDLTVLVPFKIKSKSSTAFNLAMFCSMTVSALNDWQRESLEVYLMDITKWIGKNRKAFSAHSEIIDVTETVVCEF